MLSGPFHPISTMATSGSGENEDKRRLIELILQRQQQCEELNRESNQAASILSSRRLNGILDDADPDSSDVETEDEILGAGASATVAAGYAAQSRRKIGDIIPTKKTPPDEVHRLMNKQDQAILINLVLSQSQTRHGGCCYLSYDDVKGIGHSDQFWEPIAVSFNNRRKSKNPEIQELTTANVRDEFFNIVNRDLR